MDLKLALQSEAARLGFSQARFSAVTPVDMRHFDKFIAEEWHGDMDWLATGREPRGDVNRVLHGARSVLVLAFDYGHALPPDPGGLTGRVASYAWGRDYHNFVLKRVRRLQRFVNLNFAHVRSYASVDTRPVFERAWANRAGVGYAGKNACQILPGDTSYFFLATLVLTETVAPDPPLGDHCGRCRRCIDTCPTQAILPEGGLIAKQCISYLTIEHEGPVPEALRPKLGRWCFGCDDCQEVCPHVRPRLGPDETLPRHAWLDLASVLHADDARLQARFEGTPLRRAAGPRLRRNSAYVLGNIGDVAARPALESVRESGAVADAVEWALAQLSPQRF